jgi:hypothetical protein
MVTSQLIVGNPNKKECEIMSIHPSNIDKWEEYRLKFRPNVPHSAFIAFENFLFFIGLL